MTVADPLADLKAEIAAEEAAKPPVVVEPETTEEVVEDEPKPEVKDPDDKKPEVKAEEKPKPKKKEPVERTVPVERLNEEAVKRRKLEKANEELAAELEALKNPKKPEEQPKPKQLTVEEIRTQERANARLELQLEDFVTSGIKEYSQEGFDAACNKINELIGGPSNLIAIAIEATGSPTLAAKAIFLLGQDDAPDIEKFLAMSAIRQAASLSKLATARTRKEDEPKKKKVEEDDEPPVPLRPIKGNNRVDEGLGDDVPDDVFYQRFEEKILNKARH